MLDLNADLAAFFHPSEFGASATVVLPGGAVDITGTPSTYAEQERPGSNTNSGNNSFLVGVAELRIHVVQFLTPWAAVATAKPECLLTIHEGDHAGAWRVRDIQRDGDIARLILNQA